MSAKQPYIGIDWGTSTFRLMSFDGSGTLKHIKTAADGLAQLTRPEIAATLRAALSDYPEQAVIMCGMVGSTIGLQQAPYIDCPTSVQELSARVVPVDQAREDFHRDMFIVPGMRFADDRIDVMRGEETQVLGWLDAHPSHKIGQHQLCLPGTHSKWVTVDDSRITRIQTALTGELFELLKRHSVLVSGEQVWSEPQFIQGIDCAAAGIGLIQQLFSTRARVVAAGEDAQHAASYLSGLLLGDELTGFLGEQQQSTLHLIGDTQLTARYATAAKALADQPHASTQLDDVLQWDGSDMVAVGLSSIWNAYGK